MSVKALRELSDYYLQEECDADLNDLLNFAELTQELLDALENVASRTDCQRPADHCHDCCEAVLWLKDHLRGRTE